MDAQLLFFCIALIIEVFAHAPDRIAAHFAFASVRVEHPHSAIRPFFGQNHHQAVSANALVPIAQPYSPCFGMLQRLLHTVKVNIIIAASVHFNKRTLHLFPPYLAAWCCLRVQVIAPQYVSRYLGARFTLIHRLLFDESVGLALRHIFTLDQ